ncbi:NAD(P)H-binding protein [Rossellomorea vietnamensis]|uniref:NADH-ubiquinone oxidoreductase n=1 Tax=Rossellomorea vietnamensis TaxID=218284 RepID=A0A0P6W0K9_9BACI|nr:NAD(P)H-binding protein [Rossellomorea vietnamensis]KPL58847.1 NADH-ubiquinone oxidoreductase [Rossellomorea vietnamensis]
MNKVMVIGASGGMGYALVEELINRGIEVVAFARGKEKLIQLFGSKKLVTIRTGDAENQDHLIKSAIGCEIIFHAMNLPYEEWSGKLSMITKNIIIAAERNNAKLAVVDNIYAYGKSGGVKLAEDFDKHPHTKKGKLRLDMDNLLKASSVRTLVCHFPDFYGPNAKNTYIHFTLNQLMKKKKAGYVGEKDISREFIYTKDGAKVMVDLACIDEAYNQNWNIPGATLTNGIEFEQLIKSVLGEEKGLYYISKPMFSLFALFAGRGMREALEMQYINSEPTILSGEKLEAFMGKIEATPFEQGIKDTIAYMNV